MLDEEVTDDDTREIGSKVIVGHHVDLKDLLILTTISASSTVRMKGH